MMHKDGATNGCGGADLTGREAAGIGRRSVIGALLGMGSLLMGAIVGTPIFRFVFYTAYAKSTAGNWLEIGDLDEFQKSDGPVAKTVTLTVQDGWREMRTTQRVYVSHAKDGELQVLSAICPHLGCTVAWQASQDKFVCPCHGGQFKANGEYISGPPPRGLDRLKTQVSDGKLQVQMEFFRSNVPQQETLS